MSKQEKSRDTAIWERFHKIQFRIQISLNDQNYAYIDIPIVRMLSKCENIRFRPTKWGLTPQTPIYIWKKNTRTIHLRQIESRGDQYDS